MGESYEVEVRPMRVGYDGSLEQRRAGKYNFSIRGASRRGARLHALICFPTAPYPTASRAQLSSFISKRPGDWPTANYPVDSSNTLIFRPTTPGSSSPLLRKAVYMNRVRTTQARPPAPSHPEASARNCTLRCRVSAAQRGDRSWREAGCGY